MKDELQRMADLAVLTINIAGMLEQPDYIAWVCWDGNLEYLVTDEKKLIENKDIDPSFVSAWVSAKVLMTSFERNRLRMLGDINFCNPHADLRREKNGKNSQFLRIG